MRHVPVLLNEVVGSLNLQSGFNIVDCTLGDAGHSEAMLEKTGPEGRLLGIDADPESVLRAKQYLYRFGERCLFIRDNFENLRVIAASEKFSPVNAILMDLGWSSPQFVERGRGFSFEKDEPLDMRYGGTGGNDRTASQILKEDSKEELEKIFRQYGEEKFYEAIAEAIVQERRNQPIERTGQLTNLVLKIYREKLHSEKEIPWIGGIHPATKVFQALRIAANRELERLSAALPQAMEILAPGGRLAVITFHSLEDRVVKHFFQKHGAELNIITKKPTVASPEEVVANPRSRSAKLRVAEKRSV